MFNSLQSHELQHTRFLCPLLPPKSLLKFMSIELVMPSNQLILCDPLLLMPSIFPRRNPSPIFLLFTYSFFSESVLCIRWPNFGASASASVLPMNIQDGFPLGLTGLILLSKGLLRVFSSTTVWKADCLVLSLLNGCSLTSIHDYRKSHSFHYMDLF